MIETIQKKRSENNNKKTNIQIFDEEVIDILIRKNSVEGVVTKTQEKIIAKKTILTTGTFLNGKMYTGETITKGGRLGDSSAIPLSKKLYSLKLPMGRLKTGTPARIKLSTIDLSKMEIQPEKNQPHGCLCMTHQKNTKNNYPVT